MIEGRFMEYLANHGILDNVEVADMMAFRPFVVVKLGNGAVGTARNYDVVASARGAADVAVRRATDLRRALDRDRQCIHDFLHSPSTALTLTEQAFKIAILSALSRPLFDAIALANSGIDDSLVTYAQENAVDDEYARGLLVDAAPGAEIVGVVGFGGLLHNLAQLAHVREVRVIDNGSAPRTARISGVVAGLNRMVRCEKVKFVGNRISDLGKCDAVAITASTLCNGTLDGALDELKNTRLIVQGPSGALAPKVFFDCGVALLIVELKDQRYWDAYRYNHHLYEWFTEFADRHYLRPSGTGVVRV